MEIDLDEIELMVLPTKKPPFELQDRYLKAYYCWQEVWMVKLGQKLETRDFSKNDFIMTLFYKGECVGFCFLSVQESEMFCESFSIHPKFRKTSFKFNWRDFFSHMIVETFKKSGCQILSTRAQNNKGLDYSQKILGAKKMKLKSEDYVVIDRNMIQISVENTGDLYSRISCPDITRKAS